MSHDLGPPEPAPGTRSTATTDRRLRVAPRPADTPAVDERASGASTASGPAQGGGRSAPPLRRILVAADLVAVALGWGIALLVAFATGEVDFGPLTAIAQSVLMLSAGAILLSASGLYLRRISAIRSLEVARIGRVSMALAAMSVVVLAAVDREAALLAGVVGGVSWFALLTMERGILREWINGRRATGDFGAPVLVVGGASDSTLATARFLDENPVLGFQVRGVSCPSDAGLDVAPFVRVGPPEEVVRQIRRSGVSGVVLDSSSLDAMRLNVIVQSLESTGAHVHISSGLRGIDVRRIRVSPIADEAFLHLSPFGLSRGQVHLKRAIDVLGSVTALVLLSPVLAIAAVAIRLHDGGPVLFRQERVGLGGELFELFKLRTMVTDAERRRAELEADNERSGPLFKLGHDPRVTPIGRFLRASSIDEIPQLFNVLQGSMSLVGPRPALPTEVAQFDEQMHSRLTVKPGVTGLWQVEARDLPSFDLYCRYDLLYVQNWSLGVDLTIIARTVVVVGLRAGRAMLPTRFRGSEMSS